MSSCRKIRSLNIERFRLKTLHFLEVSIERFCSDALRFIEIICSNNVIFDVTSLFFRSFKIDTRATLTIQIFHLSFFFWEIFSLFYRQSISDDARPPFCSANFCASRRYKTARGKKSIRGVLIINKAGIYGNIVD